jgi:2-oxoacid:acceptor oxidoreductase delta subunit (pyruvate/2-ketoisovalerate family)
MQREKPFAITLDPATSLLNQTGNWRSGEMPLYLDRLPPCNNACPAGENTQAWLALAEESDYEGAWRKIMEENPFPGTMGRVCYHPCETACNRVQLDEAVGINAVERFLGEEAMKHRWKIEPGADTGKKVMVVGAGPAGLTAAYHLRRFGHAVTVFEALPKGGGMIRYGIPRYRMPRERLTAEISRIEEMGVEVRYNTRVDDILATRKEGGFDAVFLATGAQVARRIDIPSSGNAKVLDALEVLRDAELERPTKLRGRIVIYGGGNTAVDVARTAVRLGCPSVKVVVLESREAMPAHHEEIKEGVEEGVDIICLRSIKQVDGTTVTLEKMIDAGERWPQPSGEFETIEADVVVQAVGQSVELDPLEKTPGLAIDNGVLQVNTSMQTGVAGVFAGGDMVPSNRTVTISVGHGKKAARHIDAYLKGTQYVKGERHEIASYEFLTTWYYSDAPRSQRPRLDIVRRTSGFAEVVGNLDEETAAYEARRCMSCGNCFECDNCYGVCPDNAITKLGPGNRFEFKYDYCKGCGICVAECPCGAIKMVPEEI